MTQLRRSPPATVCRVELHEDYDPFQPAPSIAPSRQNKHIYIFKEFSGTYAQEAYQKELHAFLYLDRTGGALGNTIIGFHGSFIHGDSPTIVLEYADRGTLEEFLNKTPPPEEGDDIIRLWEALLRLPQALDTIHNIPTAQLPYPTDDSRHSVLRGYHQDIKPSNILVIGSESGGEYDCQFRLADLGTSHFTRLGATSSHAQAVDAGGTKEYGAPECYQFSHKIEQSALVKQTVDVWSLGCVFSEFAVWTVSGPHQLKRYKADRQRETIELKIHDEGCFHDGRGPLTCVQKWNRRAFENKRNSDHVTRSVLRQMVSEMLYEESSHRPTASQLIRKAQGVIQDAITQLDRQQQGSIGTFTPPSRPTRRPTRPITWTPDESTKEDDSEISDTAPSPEALQNALYKVAEENRSPKIIVDNSLPTAIGASSPGSIHAPSRSTAQHTPRRSNFSDRLHDDNIDVVCNTPYHSSPCNGMSGPRPASFVHNERKVSLPPNAPQENENYPNGVTDGHGSFSRMQDDPNNGLPTESMLDSRSAQVTTFQPVQSASQVASKREPRYCLLRAALVEYYLEKKRKETILGLPDGHCLDPLAAPERDFVFLIDDSASMWKHKKLVIDTVKALAWLLKKYDNDGIDMYFMRSAAECHARPKHSSDLHQPLKKCMFDAQGTSDGKNRLSTLLDDYVRRYSNRPQKSTSRFSFSKTKEVKPLIIYVITDGNWEPGSDPIAQISSTANRLDIEEAHEYQLGVQFISVHAEGQHLERLERLDSGLNLRRDMVDTEPIDGNVYKMLLGPISRMWDND